MAGPVAVTGMGVVTPAGSSVEEFHRTVWQGRPAVREVDGEPLGVRGPWLVAQVEGFEPTEWLSPRETRRLDRAAQFSLAAVHQALEGAGLLPEDPERERDSGIGVAVGTAFGTAHTVQRTYFDFFSQRSTSVHSVPGCMPHSAAAAAGIRFGLTGPSFTVSTACSSGAMAIGLAFELIRSGVEGPIVAGGCDATLTSVHLENWRSMKVLARGNGTPSGVVRPFSRDRKGFVLGEGAAFVVLESPESALRRGATVLAEVLGYGCSSDATHLTAPSATGQARAVEGALASAGLRPKDVDYVNAHGTATRLNDSTETAALRLVFGEWIPPVSSIKAVTGHMLGGSSAAELVASVLAVRTGVVPPTVNYAEPDPDCDLDPVAEGCRDIDARIALSNSFAFGGNNAVLVVRRYE